jgi:hypothetical protein
VGGEDRFGDAVVGDGEDADLDASAGGLEQAPDAAQVLGDIRIRIRR